MTAYIAMIVVGFLMLCVGVVGQLLSTEVVREIKGDTKYVIVDTNGNEIKIELQPSFFQQWKIEKKSFKSQKL